MTGPLSVPAHRVHCASVSAWHSANNFSTQLRFSSHSAWWDANTMPGFSVGSVLGWNCVFQEGSHVQQSILYSLGKPGSVGVLTAVEGRDGDVDVLIHGIVTHSVAIWHHRTKAHHAVCLWANLYHTQTNKHDEKSSCVLFHWAALLLVTNKPGWWGDYSGERQQKRYPWISRVWTSGLQCSASSAPGGVGLRPAHGLPNKETNACVDVWWIRRCQKKVKLTYESETVLTLYVLSLCVWTVCWSSSSLSVFCWDIYCSVKWLSRLKGTVYPQQKNLSLYHMQMES